MAHMKAHKAYRFIVFYKSFPVALSVVLSCPKPNSAEHFI